MSDLENLIHMYEKMDLPVKKMMAQLNRQIDTFRSPEIERIVQTNARMQDLISPSIKILLEMEERLKLSVNPQFKALIDQQEILSSTSSTFLRDVSKLSREMDLVSKWTYNLETPKAVFEQLSSFSKIVDITALPLKKLQTYQTYFDRLSSFTYERINDSLNLSNLERIDYALINEDEIETESHIILLDEASRIKRIIEGIYQNNSNIYKLQPAEFEDMIAELLRFQQFEVEMTKRTRDGGYDLIAVQNTGGFSVKFLIECKRFARNRKIGVGIVRSFRDVINTQGANKGIIITSSYFSPDAEKDRLKHKPYMLDFRDHDNIIEWVSKYIRKE